MEKISESRFFSVELKSEVNLKNVTIANGDQENVLLEGTIGELQRAESVDGIVPVIVGDQGTLGVDLTQGEIWKNQMQEKEA